MRRARFFSILSLLSVFVFSSFADGFSKWVTPKESITVEATAETRAPVCYIAGTTTQYYMTVEKGLNAATSGQTVMVIPGTNPTIKANCTIKSGVTLRLPYDVTASDSMTATSQVTTVVDSTSSGVKLTVTIAEGVTLTNNGTLQISGILSGGNGGGVSSGHTATSWANLCLDKNAQYVQTGSSTFTYCYGFITEKALNNGSQCVFNSGTVYMPFILRDFRGGSVYAGMQKQKSNKCFLFNDYELKNIEPTAKYVYPASLYAMANLYADGGQNATQMVMIGSSTSSFMQLSVSGSYVEAKYNKNTQIATLDFYGGMTTNSLTLSAAGVSVSSGDYFFGIGYRHVLSFNKLSSQTTCTYTIRQDYKFLPGTSLTVGNGAVLDAAGYSLVFYSVFNDVKVGGGPYPSGKPAAYLVDNGSVTADSLAGYVTSTTANATLSVQTNNNISTSEVNGSSGSSFLTTCTFQTISNVLTFDKYDQSNSEFVSGSKVGNVPVGSYTSTTDSSSVSGFIYVSSGPYTLTITLTNSSIAITLDSGASTSYTTSTTLSINEGVNVGYTVSYTQTDSQSTSVIKPDGTTVSTSTGSFTMSGNASITATSKAASTCLIAGTLITMADGSLRKVEDIHAKDLLRVFNHETGLIETSPVVFNDVEPEKTYVFVNCLFSNGSLVKVQYEHGFFNIEENKYVYIREDNYANYIGKRFVTFDANGNRENLTLTKAYLTTETVKLYSPVTAKTLNYFTEGVLSMPGGVPGLFNIFDVDPLTLKYDEAKKESDIAKYGLLNLADFGGAITQSMFDAFNGQYLGVAVGKGLLTWDDIARMAKRYAPLC
jgi:hypothetical protein